jgi:hypothetical protein
MEINRRSFLTVGAATLALGGKVLGSNDRVRIAICGTRGQKSRTRKSRLFATWMKECWPNA